MTPNRRLGLSVMRATALIVLAAILPVSTIAGESKVLVGTWEYSGTDAHPGIRFTPDGRRVNWWQSWECRSAPVAMSWLTWKRLG
jgi:hypothetical protein